MSEMHHKVKNKVFKLRQMRKKPLQCLYSMEVEGSQGALKRTSVMIWLGLGVFSLNSMSPFHAMKLSPSSVQNFLQVPTF